MKRKYVDEKGILEEVQQNFERRIKQDRQKDYLKFKRRADAADAADKSTPGHWKHWQAELDRFFPEFAGTPLTKPL